MNAPEVYTLVNPQNGQLAFKLYAFEDGRHFDHLQRNNFYSLIWLQAASGMAKADTAKYPLQAGMLFAFSPCQPFMFAASELSGVAIHFHPDFFCIHKHQSEVACHGVLFNNIYQRPFIEVGEWESVQLAQLIGQMRQELSTTALAQNESLVSYLKLFLIATSRIKAAQEPAAGIEMSQHKEPFILQHLKEAIEKDFRTKHSAADYAAALNISLKALARAAKTYFNKTLTELIAERIIIEAKRELYLTNKQVKEIAYELGYADEYYFSRFFKAQADISPQAYRETVGAGRGGPFRDGAGR